VKKKSNFISFLVLTLFVGYGFYSNGKNPVKKISNYSTVETKDAADRANPPMMQEMTEKVEAKKVSQVKEIEMNKKTRTITTREIINLHDNYPDTDKVNEDLKQNPHSPSKTLMTFAKSMGPLMEKAFKNESDADFLIKELANCAHDDSVAVAARALCVQDTEKLAQYHPPIKSKAVELRESMPPEVQKILDTNDAFIKK